MKRFVLNSTVAAIALLTASSAFASDYNSGVVTKTPSQGYTDVEFGSGWYLRGDITFNIRGKSESTTATVVTDSDTFNVQADYDDAIGARIGAGYYVAPNIRLEANVEGMLSSNFNGLRSREFSGSRQVNILVETAPAQDAVAATPGVTDPATGITVGGTPAIPAQPAQFQSFPDTVFFDSNGNVTGSNTGVYQAEIGNTAPGIDGTELIDAEYTATSFIVSGYYDLPSLGQITPYLGAGIGLGRINYNETRELTCLADNSETCGFPAGSIGQEATQTLTRNEEYWALAYQLSAGAAYRFSDKMSVDIGYSYTDFEGGDNLSYDDGTAIDDEGFAVHQVRAGIRYDIW